MTTSENYLATSQQVARVKKRHDFLKSLGVTGLSLVLLAMFLSPFLFMVFTSLKSESQMSTTDAPIWPSKQATFTYEGQDLKIYYVPMEDGTTRELAMFKPGRTQSVFIDPQNPDGEMITWKGSWRKLKQPWIWAANWKNYADVWTELNFRGFWEIRSSWPL